MKQHKWHKEIKAWADGAEIESLFNGEWSLDEKPDWYENTEYRIKPQPKEPQYLYVYRIDNKTVIAEPNTHFECKRLDGIKFIGKIKLEDTDA